MLLLSTIMSCIAVQSENAPTLIEVTEWGIWTDFRVLHPQNAPSSILETEGGMLTDCKFSHLSNLDSSIAVMKSGMPIVVTLYSEPLSDTFSGIVMSVAVVAQENTATVLSVSDMI